MATRISPELAARVRAAWPELLSAVESGARMDHAIAAAGLKREWVRAFKVLEPGAQAEWEDAREHSADAFSDEGLEIARNRYTTLQPGEPGNEKGIEPLVVRVDPAAARVHLDYLKWMAAKRNPRAYSDKAQLDVNVKTIDLTRIISEANARLAAGRAPRILEHVVDQAIEHSASKLLELL